MRHLAYAVILRATLDAFCANARAQPCLDGLPCDECRAEALWFLSTGYSDPWFALTDLDVPAVREQLAQRAAEGDMLGFQRGKVGAERYGWIDT